ncbi:SMI1/KNR4 family protein [Streptomyces antnestii]|uniref:SMI1/KNR4 family protein n=1 Tax=Streptomyces antnestii TaxID=2494256 RepID=A0A437PEU2_9ACTN|nr:SMI1/KNR4 family protein [Streptomyces sp. San01]RVU20800.1 SMI1/KNR4 family protein [Streptomyces sp. San01]
MADQRLTSAGLHDFATWAPVLRLLRDHGADQRSDAAVRAAGRIGRGSWSLPLERSRPRPGRAVQAEDRQAEFDAVGRVRGALVAAGIDDVSFSVKFESTGQATLRVMGPSPAVESGIGTAQPGALVLVDGAVPEPWRRLPDPVPGAVPAPTADPVLLACTVRERVPDAVGATDAEIAATEARLGVALPEELKALYQVAQPTWEQGSETDYDAGERIDRAVGCELFPLDSLYVADAASRPSPWTHGAMEAVVTEPDAAVQGLVGSPGWIVFGDTGGGDRLAVDLTPGPRGHKGQIILIGHEGYVGAEIVADSLTGLVLGRPHSTPRGGHGEYPPVVAHVNIRGIPSIEAAVHPGLEVLSIGVWDDAPVSLAPAVGLPRLRTLCAYPGTLADPLEIARLAHLEFLRLGPQEWRVLLDAGAVPRSLSAASITVHGQQDVLPTVDLANEILALWDRPQIVRTVLKGNLGPAVRPAG